MDLAAQMAPARRPSWRTAATAPSIMGTSTSGRAASWTATKG